MAQLTVAELITPSTSEQVKTKLYEIAALIGLITTAWQKLSPLRAVFAVLSVLFSGYTEVQAEINRSAWVETATGNWLTIVARLMYGVTREPATFAVGVVTVDNTGGGSYPYLPGELIFLNSTTGKTYFNVSAVTIDPLEQDVLVDVQAHEAGEASTATPGQIDAFTSAGSGLVCSNALAIVGVDAETDEALRVRCLVSLGALSPNGAADAYRYVATSLELNGGVDVTRCEVLPPPGDGTVTVVIAGPSGAVSGGDVTSVDDAFHALIVREVDTVTTQSAVNSIVAYTLTVYYAVGSGLLTGDVETLAEDAITAYLPTVRIGGEILQAGPSRGVAWRAIEGVVRSASPFFREVKLASETDHVMAATDVAVPGTITVTAVGVA